MFQIKKINDKFIFALPIKFNMSKKLIVTGSMGLIGSEVSEYFLEKGWEVDGIDNNQRAVFFVLQGDNSSNKDRLLKYGTAY